LYEGLLVLVVGGEVVGADELEAELEEDGFFVEVDFDGDEGGALGEAGADGPTGEFGGEGGFAFAALAADEDPVGPGVEATVFGREEKALDG